ncbi:MAG: hypothetical protein RJA36_2829 [Pseudomonadota bacterium]|jgi:amino acid adenylation domain-containing protein
MHPDLTPALDFGGPQTLVYPGYDDDWLEQGVFQRFLFQARLHPQAIAIRDQEGHTNYADLLTECLRLGEIIKHQVPPGLPLVLALPVNRHYPAAMLAALAAGRPYVPLDLSHPPERLRHILAHCGSLHVLTDSHHRLLLQDCLPPGASLMLTDASQADLPPSAWEPTATPDDVAYVLYTSGSSGAPKGVYQNQRGLTHDVMQYTRSAHLRPGDVLTGLYSPSVNGALRDIYGALLNGATLLLFDLKREGLTHAAQAMQEWGATVLHAMPPVMRSFLRTLRNEDNFPAVRLVYLAGDKLFKSDLTQIRQRLNHEAKVYVGIGSTECATLYRQWFIPKYFDSEGLLLPSGYPIPDRHVEVLDTHGQPVPVGESGEIFVSSPYLARGYWRDEAQTHERFTPVAHRPGWFRFATGDVGSIQPDGLLVFHGRADRQVKIRGYRVEPAEVEGVLRSQPGILEAVIVTIQDEDQPRLVAFIVHTEETDRTHILENIKKILPTHACPTEILSLDALPLLGNFKVDMQALAKRANQTRPKNKSQPITITLGMSMKNAIESCWKKTLKIQQIDHSRSFQDEGGDSLKALEMHVALEKILGCRLPVDGFHMGMTANDLSSWLRNLPSTAQQPSSPTRPQMFIFPAAGGVQADTLALREEMLSDFDVNLIDYSPRSKKARYTTDISELASDCLPEILSKTKSGEKLVFLGQSYGGRVAHEVATRLQAKNLIIDLLVITDIPLKLNLLRKPRNLVHAFQRWSIDQISPILPMHWILHWKETFGTAVDRSRPIQFITRLVDACLLRRNLHHWHPEVLHSPSMMLVSGNTLQTFPDAPIDLGWSSICPNLTVLPLGLGHCDYVWRPNSKAVKSIMLDMLLK